MPRALQTIAGYYTGAAAGTGVVTASGNDSFAVANYLSGGARINQVSASGALVDFVRLRSPRFHDAQQAMKLWVGGSQNIPLLLPGIDQPLYSGDVPIVEVDVTAAGSGVVVITNDYDDFPGAQPSLDTWDGIRPRIKDVYVAETDLAGGAIGAWSAGVTLNSTYDDFHAGSMYAVLGYMCSASCAGVRLTGPDTGNLGIGGPGINNSFYTRGYFAKLSDDTGRPCIPIIAANNKAATTAQNVDSAANTAVKVGWVLAELA